MVTRKWKQEFLLLEAVGVFQVGDAGATFSLIAVYGPLIESDVNGHYLAMRQRKKRRSTCNSNYPKKTQRRWELYSLYHSRLTPLTSDELSRVREVGRLHSAGAGRSANEASQTDPLSSSIAREARAVALRELQLGSLAKEYAAHRALTMALLSNPSPESPGAIADAKAFASCEVAELRRRLASAHW